MWQWSFCVVLIAQTYFALPWPWTLLPLMRLRYVPALRYSHTFVAAVLAAGCGLCWGYWRVAVGQKNWWPVALERQTVTVKAEVLAFSWQAHGECVVQHGY